MSKIKAGKLLVVTAVCEALALIACESAGLAGNRKDALTDWCKTEAKLSALSPENDEHLRKAMVQAYDDAGLSSAKNMASQNMRFIRDYTSDAAFRAKADKASSISDCYSKAAGGDRDAIHKLTAALRKAKVMKTHSVALNWMSEHAEAALNLVENHLKEASKLGASLKVVETRQQRKAA